MFFFNNRQNYKCAIVLIFYFNEYLLQKLFKYQAKIYLKILNLHQIFPLGNFAYY